jgi:HPt (histidine-containing phosphotransfer) domain-containing protein
MPVANRPEPTTLDARFAQLQQRFLLGLGPRRAALAAAWHAWAHVGAPPEALASELHRLAGAAGAYGLPALGSRAQALEAGVRAPTADPASLAASFDALQHELSTLADPAAPASGAP